MLLQEEAERCRGRKLLPGSGACQRRVRHLSPSPSEEPPRGLGSAGRHRRLPAGGALRAGPCPVCIYTHSVSHLSLGLSARRLVHMYFHPPDGNTFQGWAGSPARAHHHD